MPFANPAPAVIQALLRQASTIAVVGLSDNPQRPSHEVASRLLDHGYRIIPVTPTLERWQGIQAVPTLERLPEVLAPGERVDIVDVFRQPQHVAGIVDDCIRLGLPALWLQLGVVDPVAAQRAVAAGMTVVMDKCLLVERMKMP